MELSEWSERGKRKTKLQQQGSHLLSVGQWNRKHLSCDIVRIRQSGNKRSRLFSSYHLGRTFCYLILVDIVVIVVKSRLSFVRFPVFVSALHYLHCFFALFSIGFFALLIFFLLFIFILSSFCLLFSWDMPTIEYIERWLLVNYINYCRSEKQHFAPANEWKTNYSLLAASRLLYQNWKLILHQFIFDDAKVDPLFEWTNCFFVLYFVDETFENLRTTDDLHGVNFCSSIGTTVVKNMSQRISDRHVRKHDERQKQSKGEWKKSSKKKKNNI